MMETRDNLKLSEPTLIIARAQSDSEKREPHVPDHLNSPPANRTVLRRSLATVKKPAWFNRSGVRHPEAFASIIEQLVSDEAIEFRYKFSDGHGPFALIIDCLSATNQKEFNDRRPFGALDAALKMAYPDAEFKAYDPSEVSLQTLNRQTITPSSWVIDNSLDRLKYTKPNNHLGPIETRCVSKNHWLPNAANSDGLHGKCILADAWCLAVTRNQLDGILHGLGGLNRNLELVFRFEPFSLEAKDLRLIDEFIQYGCFHDHALAPINSRMPCPPEFKITAQNFLNGWFDKGRGHRIVCEISSETPIDIPLLSTICWELSGFPISNDLLESTGQHLDLRGCLPTFEPVLNPLASAEIFNSLGIAIPLPCPRASFSDSGSCFGETSDGTRVVLTRQDLARHTYIVGATGSGKSTLLLNLIRQDIDEGEGVILIDPHGDLFAQALKAVPLHRNEDLVVLDFTNFDNPPSLNILDIHADYAEISKNFICNELIRIFSRVLYRDIPEAFGPIFEMYFRNSLLLIMQERHFDSSLLDFERVYSDPQFRKSLLETCPDKRVKEFWEGVAEKITSDDWSLTNIAPYILSKLTQFTGNAFMRRIVGHSNATIDFSEYMDRKHIVLVNLSKGLLGEMDSQLLGMLLLGKIYLAAMRRVQLPESARTPVRLYIDEFQNLATESLANMLSEARKFGLHLTLANQTLSQIDGRGFEADVSSAVLANVANLIAFRVGVPDADRLGPWFKPGFSKEALTQLPDYQVAARLLTDGKPVIPFTFRTMHSSL